MARFLKQWMSFAAANTVKEASGGDVMGAVIEGKEQIAIDTITGVVMNSWEIAL